jgi:HSP20 family molecular chaperone IbpA
MNNVIRSNTSLLDDFFDDFFGRPIQRNSTSCMRTDIKEIENGYELIIDVPGFSKEEIKISLDKGYLTVEAEHQEENEDKKGRFVRRERFLGSAARTYYVGDDIAQQDIKAAYEKGTLTLEIPKQGTNVKEKHYIAIE